MPVSFRALLKLCFMATVLCYPGCTSSDLPETAPVTGQVTYQGKPLPNADVTFVPEAGVRNASGRTDADGRYKLGTFSIDDGAVIGKHRISVMARGPDRPLKPGEVGTGMPGEMAPGDPLIPVKYFTPESSGLSREVVDGNNVIDLTLTD